MTTQQGPHPAADRTKVVTLCGSTRFEAELAQVNQRLTLPGCVVIRLGMFRLPDLPGYDRATDARGSRGWLAAVRLQKIRMADEVFVVYGRLPGRGDPSGDRLRGVARHPVRGGPADLTGTASTGRLRAAVLETLLRLRA